MLSSLANGFTAYLRAMPVISRLGLWSYALVPVLLSLLLAAAIGWAAIAFSDEIGAWLGGLYPWERGQGLWLKVVNIFGGLLILTLGLILFKHLVFALSSPFMSFFSEKIEEGITGRRAAAALHPAKMLRDLVRGLRLSLRNVLRELFFTGLLLLLGFIPGLALAIPLLILLVQAYYAGAGNLDYTLERRHNARDTIAYVRRHRFLAIGNGLAFVLLLFTGIGFLVAIPLGTAAATLEVVALEERRGA